MDIKAFLGKFHDSNKSYAVFNTLGLSNELSFIQFQVLHVFHFLQSPWLPSGPPQKKVFTRILKIQIGQHFTRKLLV